MDVLNKTKVREMEEKILMKVNDVKESNTDIGALYLCIYDKLDIAHTDLQVNEAINRYYFLENLVNEAIEKGWIDVPSINKMRTALERFGCGFTRDERNGELFTSAYGVAYILRDNKLITVNKQFSIENSGKGYIVKGNNKTTKMTSTVDSLDKALQVVAITKNGGIRR